jgi:hypothetical protein
MKKCFKHTLCIVLAVVMLTGAFPVFASGMMIDAPLNGVTGDGWSSFDSSPTEIIFGSDPIPDPGVGFSDGGDGEDILPTDDSEVVDDAEADDPLAVDSNIAEGDTIIVNCQLSIVLCPPTLPLRFWLM